MTAIPVTGNGRPSRVTSSPTLDAERVGEGALHDHPAGAHPGAVNDLRLVDRSRCLIPSLRHHVRRDAVCLEHGPGDRVRSAVGDDTGSMGQRRETAKGAAGVAVGR